MVREAGTVHRDFGVRWQPAKPKLCEGWSAAATPLFRRARGAWTSGRVPCGRKRRGALLPAAKPLRWTRASSNPARSGTIVPLRLQ